MSCNDMQPFRLTKAAYAAKYYIKNREKLLASRARYRLENLEKVLAGQAKYRSENREKIIADSAAYYAKNRAKILSRSAKHQKKNPKQSAARSSKYYAKNKNKEKKAKYYIENNELIRARVAKWSKINSYKRNILDAKRRARKLNATPKWADQEAINDIYIEAAYQEMEVDHIIPLQGKRVCGLHVAYNLQLLTKSQNAAKGCRFNTLDEYSGLCYE